MKKVFTVAKYTFLEVLRSKLMIVTPLLGAFIILISFVASSFAYGAPSRVAVDVGLGLLSLSNLFFAIFIGANLVSKELESKTIYMIVSKPVSRDAFIFGKILGFVLVLFINSAFLTAVTTGIGFFYNAYFDHLFLMVGVFSFFESLIVLLAAVFFSLITNVSLTVVFTILFFIFGQLIGETKKLLFAKINEEISIILKISEFIIPDLSRFNLKDMALYTKVIPMNYFWNGTISFFLYTAFFLLLITFIFKRKDLV